MEFTIKTGSPEKLKRACIVVGAYAEGRLTPSAEAVDHASGGALGALLKRGDLDDKAGATLTLPLLPGVEADRVVVVSLGAVDELNDKAYRDALSAAGKALAGLRGKDASVSLAEVEVPNRDLAWRLRQAARLVAAAGYRFDAPKKSADDNGKRGIKKIQFLIPGKSTKTLTTAVDQGLAIAEGMALARNLGNLPPNVCSPTYLADTAKKLGKEYKLKVTVLEKAEMSKLGMGALLAVAQGAEQPPKFIIMEHAGGKAGDAPIVLVGKGITFDTGGISLKPAAEMDEMKYDMCGAASVFGTLKAAAQLNLPINVVGIVPSTENMPGGNATRPGDVVTSMSGQTIEILNTDAEGRLILCDALTYAERFKPACVIDIATLTGACVVALGKIPSGLLTTDDALARELTELGQSSGDRVWQLPLWDDYQELLKSNFADMANIGGRYGGTITAAAFLARFTKAYPWAHLDIAGTAWISGEAKGATGRPVPLLTEFLIARAGLA
ncbi:leucyl aminopeptidase [Denitromonas iodatirespirans]|uniref:Probable cytosol aminopeptidase n=1 Tax=Denitromonas iodatirespirans TaxID=2795389 RepID=A0A944D5M8_DENI1|nr:leucyl aminopeptidase [Denitromonas iodatirespirans]MBT0960420.1 leucyl aminopeptidase [Denitromonas iodatirespirans]